MHDFNPEVRHSGLFWVAQVPDGAFFVMGDTARLHLQEIPLVDSTFFLGPGNTFVTANLDVTWTSSGPVQHFRPLSTDPADPTNFAAEFRSAVATGSFTVFEGNTTFTSAGASSDGIFAELGTERNGVFLHRERDE